MSDEGDHWLYEWSHWRVGQFGHRWQMTCICGYETPDMGTRDEASAKVSEHIAAAAPVVEGIIT